MAGFYIQSITAFGYGKKDAIVEFHNRLNIITGYSDTGKTCILRCIEFIFGNDIQPFDTATGYEGVSMVVVAENGPITFQRFLGKKQVEVSSFNADIESGTYAIEYRAGQKKPVLNEVWLRLIGIHESHQVPSNKKFEKKRLTWKTLRPLRLVDEDRIGTSASIIEPVQVVEKTLFLSSLLFLLTGRDFSEIDSQKTRDLKKARRQAIEEYVNQKLKSAAERQRKLEEELKVYPGIDVSAELEKILNEIQNLDTGIAEAVTQSRELSAEILRLNTKVAESDLMISRYESLSTQYKADIKRLLFIAEGEEIAKDVPHHITCPFCKNGRIRVEERPSYLKSAQAELQRTMQQLNGLHESILDVKKDRDLLQYNLHTCRNKREQIEIQLKEKMWPRFENLSKQKNDYIRYLELQNGKKFLQDMADNWQEDLRELQDDENSDKDIKEYHPKDYFGDEFLKMMDQYAGKILAECSYENLLTAAFSLQDFDIVVNGRKKATNHGKGYRAFLNTVVALMFRRYLAEHAKYNPGILMIDTPLLGLDQGVDDAAPESMRMALFRYLVHHQDGGQLIVVENWEHIPKLQYEDYGAKVIMFTKGRTGGRKGFLYDV